MDIQIQITQASKTKSTQKKMILDCRVSQLENMSPHDEAAFLFALEFAANNHAELPIRVHINQL